jgi:hypothetical protein
VQVQVRAVRVQFAVHQRLSLQTIGLGERLREKSCRLIARMLLLTGILFNRRKFEKNLDILHRDGQRSEGVQQCALLVRGVDD